MTLRTRADDGDRPFVMTWVPDEALVAFTGIADPASAHVESARRLGVDIVLVDAQACDAGSRAAALLKDGFALAWAVPGPLSRVEARSGYAEVLADTAREPGALAYRLDEALHESLDDVRAGVRHGAGVFVVADDLASPSGWLVSPDFALDVLMRGYRRLVREVREAGAEALMHSDGDVRALYSGLAAAGFAGVHVAGLAGSARDAAFAAARRSGLAVVGGIGAGDLSAGGSAPSEFVLGTRAQPDVWGDEGGITSAGELEAFRAIIETLRRTR